MTFLLRGTGVSTTHAGAAPYRRPASFTILSFFEYDETGYGSSSTKTSPLASVRLSVSRLLPSICQVIR